MNEKNRRGGCLKWNHPLLQRIKIYRLAGRFCNSINSALLYDLKSKFSCVVSNSLGRTSKLQSMLSETHQLVFWKAKDSKWRVFPKLYAATSDQNNSNSVLALEIFSTAYLKHLQTVDDVEFMTQDDQRVFNVSNL